MFDLLLRASVDGAILAFFAWLITRLVPSIGPSARAILWWCVAAKFVVALVWTTPIRLPVLPAPAADRAAVTAVAVADGRTTTEAPFSADEPKPDRVPWPELVLLMWAIGVGIAAARAARQWDRAAAVRRRATAVDARTAAIAHEVAEHLQLRRVPPVSFTDEIDSPLVTGLLAPVVLLPETRFGRMTAEQQRMSLCHELAHVGRRDLWFGCVPAIAERVFFFHPLVRLAAREYHFWREAACDAVVLDVLHAPPKAYGALLLELGVCRPASRLAAAGAARSFSILKRRMLMLSTPSHTLTTRSRILTGMFVVLGLLAVAPFQLSARPHEPITTADVTSADSADPVPPSRDVDDLRFVYFINDDHTTMSGSSDDIRRARRLKVPGEPMLWFIHDGKAFVVRDRATLRELETIWEPVARIGGEQGKIGAQQGEIGARQGEIGARQGAIGAQQGAVGAKQGAIGARQADLAVRESRARTDREWQEIARERRELDQAMRDLDREMAVLNEKMREASKPMEDLGEEMEKLGAEMGKLGAQMEAASRKARAELRRLIERAIANGTAQEVR